MSAAQPFAVGDQVVHTRRPEWGVGTVRTARSKASSAPPDDAPQQRLTVHFVRHGRVTLDTSVAPLRLQSQNAPSTGAHDQTPAALSASRGAGHASKEPVMPSAFSSGSSSTTSDSGGWLAALDKSTANSHELWDLPDALTNPFATLTDRLKATLQTYKYSTQPRPLMDWACVQTGLADPLSKYTRHELEQAFPRYARDRDQHLRELVKQCKRNSDYAALKEAGRGLLPAAQSALDKAIRK